MIRNFLFGALVLVTLTGCKGEEQVSHKTQPFARHEKTSPFKKYQKDLRTYLELRSQLKDGEAMTLLGEFYTFGVRADRDHEKAYEYFEKAANLGHARAQNHQAWMLAMGRGVQKDTAKAQEIWQKSCNAGFEPACQRIKNTPKKLKAKQSKKNVSSKTPSSSA